MYCFDFRSDWSFRRKVQPSLGSIRDFETQTFDARLDQIGKRAGRPLTAIETDFAWLALAIYAADRFASRHPFGIDGTSFWRRRIHVRVPMRERQLWLSVEPKLIRALELLTEDDWTFDFSVERARFSIENQEYFRGFSRPDVQWASLFSGGLDSLAGALHWIMQTGGRGLLVSGHTHNRMRVAQELLVEQLSADFPDSVDHLGVYYGFPDKQEVSGIESSQRTRAFVHVCLGALAALTSGGTRLFLFENGVGAFNLSCDSAQIGSQNSQGTHPVFLSRMEDYVSGVFKRPFTIENPFAFTTKGQMLALPGLAGHQALLHRSFSCDRFPNYPHRAPQCGHCPSCLIRRLAFHASGLTDPGDGYSTDVRDPSRPLRDSDSLAIMKLSIQADTLANALAASHPWEALCATWPALFSAELEIKSPQFSDHVRALLQRHVAEWRSFSETITTGFMAAAA
jgi:7-cyano-7-deazaguanine synthase in queuosine biosynthesis